MLNKQYRLKNKKEIAFVYKSGKKTAGKNLILRFILNNKQLRFAFVVSKNKVKKAVERNKIKRMLRVIINAKIDKIIKKADIVIEYKGYINFINSKEEYKKIKIILDKEIDFLFQQNNFYSF